MRETMSPTIAAAVGASADPHGPLPAVVCNYLGWAGVNRSRHITSVSQRFHGRLRTRLDGAWYPVEGELRLEPDQPERLWTGVIKPFPLVRIAGRDSYSKGAGRMLIRAYSRFVMADVRGPEMDASALVTILAELPLAPTALAPSEWLSWSAIDQTSARATLRDGALSVSGVFHFGPLGEPLRFETKDRFRQVGKAAVRTPWLVKYHRHALVDGWNVPVEMEAAWQLDDCVLRYARMEARQTRIETR